MVKIVAAKRKRRYQKRKQQTSKMDMAVVILIVVSILLAVLIYTKSGMIGTKLNEILGGIFGIVQYILPIGVFVLAIKIASNGNEEFKMKLVQYGVLLIALSIVLSVLQISGGELQTNGELSSIVKDAYYLGSQSKGGGAIGALGAVPLVNLLGVIGAIILCLGIAVILILNYIFVNKFLNKLKDKRKELAKKEVINANKETYKEFFIRIIPVIIMVIAFSFVQWTPISSFGMVMIWGISLIALYNVIVTNNLLKLKAKKD